jgi:hypothetical protein
MERKTLNMSSRRITMLSFLKRIFGAKPAEPTAAPYKVEEVAQFPFPKPVTEKKPVPKAKKPAAKKPAAKKAPKKSKE